MSAGQAAAPPERVVVVGSGTMGAGTALAFALAGSQATVTARRDTSLERAARQIDASLALLAAHGQIAKTDVEPVRARIHYTREPGEQISAATLIIESIVERAEPKRELLAEISTQAAADAVIATNTSSLPLDELAEVVRKPARFAGYHWFNPPELVSLVELVPSAQTAPATIDRLAAWSVAIGKTPVRLVRAVPGFVANRLQYALLREAYALVEEGACDMAAVDEAVTACLGPRWAAVGPFESMDLAGLDVHAEVAAQLFPALSDRVEVPAVLTEMIEDERLGAKSGEGLRGTYDEGTVGRLAERRVRALTQSLDG